MSFSVVFIGAGNLASHLAVNLSRCGYRIVQIYSRTENSAKSVAESTGSAWTSDPSQIQGDADIYFIALKDAAFQEVLSAVNLYGKRMVHCSGSLPMSVLHEYTSSYGVFYPLQTFTRGVPVDFSVVPVFIESSSEDMRNTLSLMAERLGAEVHYADSRQRLALHIAAVFACNFVNHFYTVASLVMQLHHLDYSLLHPLMMETLRKATVMQPFEAQTGPAVRSDTNIISRHLEALGDDPELYTIYKNVSQHIYKLHQK